MPSGRHPLPAPKLDKNHINPSYSSPSAKLDWGKLLMLLLVWSCWGSGLREAWTRKLPGVWGTVPTSTYSHLYIFTMNCPPLPLFPHISIGLSLHSTFNIILLWRLVSIHTHSWAGLASQVSCLHILVLQSARIFFLRHLGQMRHETHLFECLQVLMTSCIRTLDHTWLLSPAAWSLNHVLWHLPADR